MFTTFLLAPIFVANIFVGIVGHHFVRSDVVQLPNVQAVLILGASVYSDGSLSDVLKARVDEAIEIYNAGKVKKILVSGFVDFGYNEPLAIKNYLLESGIFEDDILLDENGVSTSDSLKNAKNIFHIKSLIIPTQSFHVSRAVFDGIMVGLNVYGVAIEDDSLLKIEDFRRREMFVKVKDFLSF